MDAISTAILVYPEVEVLDFCGPFEVFSATRLDEARRREAPSPFAVRLVAERPGVVVATGGLKVTPDHAFADAPPCRLLVVPGGWGARREVDNPALVDWVRRQALGAEVVMSVCTGSFLLATAGLLAGRRATTHWGSLDRMRQSFPEVSVEDRLHWVEDGPYTSAGISAGIDLSLTVVARMLGEAVARATARYMEYPYPTDDARRVALG